MLQKGVLLLILIGLGLPGRLSMAAGISEGDASPSWPVTVVVGPNHAVVSEDRVFLEGDSLVFSLESDTLWARGTVWRSYVPFKAKRDSSARGSWTRELCAFYQADSVGTNVERMRRALRKMDPDVLDPDFAPRLDEGQLTLRFKGGEMMFMILQEPEMGPPEVEARKEVGLLRKTLGSPMPCVVINWPAGGRTHGGEVALGLIATFEHARQGKVTEADLRLARNNYVLEAVEAVAARGRKK